MTDKLRNWLYRWLPLAVWCLLIFFFSSLPKTSVGIDYWTDFTIKKTAHIIEYAILAILSYRAFGKSVFKALIFTILYAVSDEFHQSLVPGREPRVRDVLFDTIGALGGIWVLKYIPPEVLKKLKI